MDKKMAKTYFIFTKTNWRESPRLRHQVVNLLVDNEDTVIFFEKPINIIYFFKELSRPVDTEKIKFFRHFELFHHQLRLFGLLRFVNSIFEKFFIKLIISKFENKDVRVVNFNYDYYFLRDVFPNNKIVTIINDDFISQARFLKGRHVSDTLKLTCKMSNSTLVVSYPLLSQLKKWCEPELFFPWADQVYKKPEGDLIRDSVLIWAHIDRRIDFELICNAASIKNNITFDFVGPIAEKLIPTINSIKLKYSNIKFIESTDLNNLKFGKYFATLIPYKKNVKDIEAVSVSNKTFQLLARGLPVITHGMPNFYNHTSIAKTTNVNNFVDALNYFEKNFNNLQTHISEFVGKNQSKDRFTQIEKLFDI